MLPGKVVNYMSVKWHRSSAVFDINKSELTYASSSIKVKPKTWLTSTSKASLCIEAKLTALTTSKCTLIYI